MHALLPWKFYYFVNVFEQVQFLAYLILRYPIDKRILEDRRTADILKASDFVMNDFYCSE